MASRTQVVCLCEGVDGRSIDPIFINAIMKAVRPNWLRRHGSNVVRLVPCGNRQDVIDKMPHELRNCLNAGGDTTLMVWADCDDDCSDCEALKEKFFQAAQQHEVKSEDFDRIVFIFAKDRLENWIEYLRDGRTDESQEGPRVKDNRAVSDAAKKLGKICKEGKPIDDMPLSLRWSCENWHSLTNRMRSN